MRYVSARIKLDRREEAYRFYVTEALKALGDLNIRYVDLLTPQIEETRTSEEIVNHIRGKLNGSI